MTLQTRLSDLITAVGTDIKQTRVWITGSSTGDLTALATTAKNSLIAAINEVKAQIGSLTSSGISDFSTAVDARISTKSGVSGGFAPLDSGIKIPSTYLPAYVDDVLEYATVSALPTTGAQGIIYVITSGVDINKEYRWSGSTYIQLTASPGTSDAVPEGTTNLYYTTARSNLNLKAASNLSDIGNPATALSNLGGQAASAIGNPDIDLAGLYSTAKT